MALGIWKPSQKRQRGLDMASHTSLDIHSNEGWNYYDYILIKKRSGTIKSAHQSGTNEFNTKENARIRYDMVEVKNKFTNTFA